MKIGSSQTDSADLDSLDLKSGKETTLLSAPQLPYQFPVAFCLHSNDRIIYSRDERAPSPKGSNLWELWVNPHSQLAGTPRKITHWSGATVWGVSASADGRRLAVLKTNIQSDVYIGQLEANGTRLKTPRRLTLDERNDIPGPWMPDSKSVLFSSDRNGACDIFKQAIDQPSAEPLVTGPEDKLAKGVTPDGEWLLYTAQKQGEPVKLMRIPMSGGQPELVFNGGVDFLDFNCAKRPPSTHCVVVRRDRKWTVYSAYDLATRQTRDLAKVEHAADWDFFLDGSRLAVLINDQGKSRIRIVRFSGETEREFTVGRSGIQNVWSTADGKGVYLGALQPGLSTVLYADLQGRTHVLWQQKGDFGYYLYPSPDGRYLSLTGMTATSDAWLLENF